jgi:reactive intermediate/imine deaminase
MIGFCYCGFMLKPIHTPSAPQPNGHYSQAVLAGSHLFISVQLPMKNDAEESSSIEWQTQSVLSSLLSITQAAGGGVRNIARVTFYVKDLSDWGRINEVFAKFMGDHKPARGVVAVAALKDNWLVAADAIAVIG